MALTVLYEDNHLIAVFKPAGVLVQGDKTGDATLMDEVKYYLKQKYHKTGKVFLGLIHRLDRPVAGVVLFAKTSKGASRLSEQFRNHTVEKIYEALVEGVPPQGQGQLVHFLKKDKEGNVTTVYDNFVPGSQRAELQYEVLDEKMVGPVGNTPQARSLLRIKLGTGRSHQIRAQLAKIGCPIVGDVKYGASSALEDKAIALTAASLIFDTATGEKRVTVRVDSFLDKAFTP
ncbi:MAG: RluA family pseudouridine synthase [Candidatus Magasanikbacteria bacterium]|nr:RluA family pseudouridine synthase [Candidatus Magasanikbacteria bacterium]